MAIRQFDLGPFQALRRAAADNIPNLIAVAGPNGSGKSTLLDRIRAQRSALLEPGSELMFVGAHRTWRSSSVSEVAVLGFSFGYEEVLKQDSIPSFSYQVPGNLNWLPGLARLFSSADDAQALVKSSVIKIRNKQRELLMRAYEVQGRQIALDSIPDLFAPFSELVSTLLPHLAWEGVDGTNVNDVRCQFSSRATPSISFDIDDLSSGEKAAVALFLPFIERQVKALTDEVQPTEEGLVPVTVVIDEPELHMHPLLQLNVLDYMRRLASEGRAQFIFATHSPTLLDALDNTELLLLSPSDIAPDNQLSRVTDSAERLELARSITGSTHLLTRAKPVVFVEGEPDSGSVASDERLLRLLVPDVAHWALIAMSGKSQVIKAVAAMRGAELELPGTPVFGLVDADTATHAETLPDFIVTWPVAMVENLLLDPTALRTLLGPYAAVTGLDSESAISASLEDLAALRRDEEIDLRVRSSLPRMMLDVSARDLGDFAVEHSH